MLKKIFFIAIVNILFDKESVAQNKYTCKVKLIEYSSNKLPPYCGYFAFATTLKFELMDSINQYKKGQKILVIITCPRELGEKIYVNNQQYILTFCNDKERKKQEKYGWSIFYTYKKEKLPTFWCEKLIQAF